MPTALITGASRGFGHALAHDLAARGYDLIVNGRDHRDLAIAVARLRRAVVGDADVVALAGDITDPDHRDDLVEVVVRRGRLDLLVNNAGTLGPSPLPDLATVPVRELRETVEVNTVAPLALTQALLPTLAASSGTIVNISSDAAVEAYPGWGVYGASKVALDHLGAVLAAENDAVRIYTFDPGDMRTDMHQAAFPGEDISDRPTPEEAVPALWHLLESAPPSGRYRGADLLAPVGGLL
jgi:NAD(P)-dependent dehydrogenase (short-subunit alcohol dehydrogenase family)